MGRSTDRKSERQGELLRLSQRTGIQLLTARWKMKRLEKRKPASLEKMLRSLTNLPQAKMPEFFTLTKLSTLTCPWANLRKEPTGWQQHRGKSTDETWATTVVDTIEARFCLNLHHLPADASPLCLRPGLVLEHSSKNEFQGEPVREQENSWQTGTATKEVGAARPEGEELWQKLQLPLRCWCEDP